MARKTNTRISSLEKGLYLLTIFARAPYKFTISQLEQISDFNRTTIYRILTTLVQTGMLIKDAQSKIYKMGPMSYHLGNIYLSNANYKDSILNILEKISKESAESVGIADRVGNKVVSLFEVETYQIVKINDQPGTYYPMNRGCYGKCLMAYHDPVVVEKLLDDTTFEKVAPNALTDKESILKEYARIREQGYVESVDEVASYICGVGVPLRNRDNRVESVVAISFFRQDNYLEKLERMKAILFKYQPELEKFIV
ncbi:MAG: IclR family transcriptional regulator [Anaerolineaceae bacterium]|nr:IclR family transcriptional regulator [Anaerolineaceae bacterium]